MKTPKFDALMACVLDLSVMASGDEADELFSFACERSEQAYELTRSDKVFDGTYGGREALYGAYLAAYGFLMLCVGVLVNLAEEGIVTDQQLHDLAVRLQEANDEHLALAAELANHNEVQKWHA